MEALDADFDEGTAPQKKTNGWVQMKLDPLKRRCMDIGDDHGYHVQVPCQFSRV